MPADLEDRLRSALAADPDEGVGARLRDRIRRETPSPRRQRALPALRRLAGPALAALGATAVVAILALLLVAAPSDPPAAPDALWGVEAVLRPVPRSDAMRPEEAAERLATVLEAQGNKRGIANMTVDRDGDRVRVFVPRTHDLDWPRMLLSGVDAAVVDLGGPDVVARSTDLARVLAAVEIPADAPGPQRWYAAVVTDQSQSSVFAGPYATRAEAEAWRLIGKAPARAVRVPADLSLVLGQPQDRNLFPKLAVRDPLVGPGGVADVRAGDDGRRLVVEVAADDRARTFARLAAADAADVRLIVSQGPPAVLSAQLAGSDADAGTITFNSGPAGGELADMLAGGGLDATVAVEDVRPVGTAPPRTGDRPAEVPAPLRRVTDGAYPLRAAEGSLLRVVRTRFAGEEWSLWTYLVAGETGLEAGTELVATTGPSEATSTGGCPPSPEHPLIALCGGGAGYVDVPDVGRTYFGRVAEDVARLSLELEDGRTFEAAVDNGYFLVVLPPDLSGRADLVARDANGGELGRESANGPVGLPMR